MTAPARSGRAGERRWYAAVTLGAAALTAIAFGPAALEATWSLDDGAAITGNPLATWPVDAEGLLRTPYFGPAPAWSQQGVSRPLATLSFAIEDGLAASPRARHLTSLVLHALVASLWGALLIRLGRRWRLSPHAAGLGGCVTAAAFAVWPIHAEAVMGLAFRPELLASLAMLAAAHALVDDARLAAAAALGLALLSKESALASLVLFALVLALRPDRPAGAGWRTAAALTLALLAFVAWRAYGVALPQVSDIDNPLWRAGIGERLRGAAALVDHSAWRLIDAARLAPDYSFDAIALRPADGAAAARGAALLLLAALALAAAARRLLQGGVGEAGRTASVAPTAAAVALGLGSAAALWLPTSQLLVPATLVTADRLWYGPTGGFALAAGGLVAVACHDLARVRARVTSGVAVAAGVRRWHLGVAAGLLAGAAATVVSWTFDAAEVAAAWRSDATLLPRGVRLQPRSVKMRYNYGRFLLDAGDAAGAAVQLDAALAIVPGDRGARLLRVQARTRLRQCDGALADLLTLLAASPPRAAERRAAIDLGAACTAPRLGFWLGAGLTTPASTDDQRVLAVGLRAAWSAAGAGDAAAEVLGLAHPVTLGAVEAWAAERRLATVDDAALVAVALWAADSAEAPAEAARWLLRRLQRHRDQATLAELKRRCAEATAAWPTDLVAECAPWRGLDKGGR